MKRKRIIKKSRSLLDLWQFRLEHPELHLLDELKKEQKTLYMQDVRYLCEQGIPAVEIAVRNIPIEYFKKGVEKWLDGLGK